MEFRSLLPGELEAWADHCAEVFSSPSNPVGRDYFLRHFHDDPWRDCNGIFVAADGEAIVSTVRVFRRKVWLLDQAVPMGGIGEVSTKPAYQGRGLAGTLLGMAAGWMVQQGLTVSVLYTGLHDFYRRYGWEVLPKTQALFRGLEVTPCLGRPMQQDDLAALMAVDAAAASTNWRVKRENVEYWDKWMRSAIGKCAVAIDGCAAVAWLAYGTLEDRWTVRDFRALPGREDLFAGLCCLAAEIEGRRGQAFTAPAWLAAGLQPAETMTLDYSMVRLNNSFRLAGKRINSTQDLIGATGECRDCELDHF